MDFIKKLHYHIFLVAYIFDKVLFDRLASCRKVKHHISQEPDKVRKRFIELLVIGGLLIGMQLNALGQFHNEAELQVKVQQHWST